MKRSRLKEKSYNQLGETSRELEGLWEKLKDDYLPQLEGDKKLEDLIDYMDDCVENIVEVTKIVGDLAYKLDRAIGS